MTNQNAKSKAVKREEKINFASDGVSGRSSSKQGGREKMSKLGLSSLALCMVVMMVDIFWFFGDRLLVPVVLLVCVMAIVLIGKRTGKLSGYSITIGLGSLIIIIGLCHLSFGYLASRVDSRSVFLILSENVGTLQDTIDRFYFSDWRKPSSGIRPFESDQLNFKDSRILKYRVGFLPDWLVFRTYYEAEYLSPDGSRFTGPALGPLPFTSPNVLVSVLHIVAGGILFVRQVNRKTWSKFRWMEGKSFSGESGDLIGK